VGATTSIRAAKLDMAAPPPVPKWAKYSKSEPETVASSFTVRLNIALRVPVLMAGKVVLISSRLPLP
jgi:hypothetical protein